MTDTSNAEQGARRARHDAIRAEVDAEDAEAAEAEAAEKTGALDVPMHLRIDSELDQQLRQRGARLPIGHLGYGRRRRPLDRR